MVEPPVTDPASSPSFSDPVLEALWRRAQDEWDADGAHQALLERAHSLGRLGELAAHYRRQVGSAERAACAERQLKAITILALAQLEGAKAASKSPKAGHRLGALWLLLLLGLLLLATHLYFSAYLDASSVGAPQ